MLDRGTNKFTVGCAAETLSFWEWAIYVIVVDGLVYSKV